MSVRIKICGLTRVDDARVAVEPNTVPGLEGSRDAVHVDHARDGELPRDDRRVAERTAELGHDPGGDAEERGPPHVRRVNDEDLPGEQIAHL